MGSILAHGHGSSALSRFGRFAPAEAIPVALPMTPPATKAAPPLRKRLREQDALLLSSPMVLSSCAVDSWASGPLMTR